MKIKKAHLQYGDLLSIPSAAHPVSLVSDIWVPDSNSCGPIMWYCNDSWSPRKIRTCPTWGSIIFNPANNIFIKKFYHFPWPQFQEAKVIGMKRFGDPGYIEVQQMLKVSTMFPNSINLTGELNWHKSGTNRDISHHGLRGTMYLLKVASGQNGWTSSSLLKRIQARVIRTEIK